MTGLQILTGDCREVLPTLEAGSVQCCVTSPPYWGLRDYGTAQWEGGDEGCDHRKVIDPVFAVSTSTLDGGQKTTGHLQEGYKDECPRCGARRIDSQLGLEATPEEYITNMVTVFREVWRVLRDDGTCWINLGDSYASDQKGNGGHSVKQDSNAGSRFNGNKLNHGLKPKDLCGIPWRLALALQADGWYLRSDIIWHKPNPMPESVTDRPTKSHEYIFLLTKAERYFYDAEAIRENASKENGSISVRTWGYEQENSDPKGGGFRGNGGLAGRINDSYRNKRSVWTIATQPYPESHFATFPEELPKLCILAGSKPGDVILDPFAGSGTVGQVALELGRRAILIELNPAYIELAQDRTLVTPGFF